MRWYEALVLAGATLACTGACSSPQRVESRAGVDRGAAGSSALPTAAGGTVEQAMCAATNPFCAQNPMPAGSASAGSLVSATCGAEAIDLRPVGVNIMLAVDGAAAMRMHWSDLSTAIQRLRANNPTASFGVHLFWADAVDLSSDEAAQAQNTTNNACSAIHNQVLPLGNHTADDLVSFTGTAPQGGSIFGSYQVDAVLSPLSETYLRSATELADATKTNYLILFTQAQENCFGSAYSSVADKRLAFQKVASELSKRNIRLIPVGVDSPTTMPSDGPFGIGSIFVGDNAQSITADYDTLTAMLEQGGSRLKEVPRIDTPEKLDELVAKVGLSLSNCRFEIPATLDASKSLNPFEIGFRINGIEVPRDRSEVEGWNFVRGNTSQVELYGQACEALGVGMVVEASRSCSQDVCGNAAVSVSTKPRNVLLLLDSSASRIECSDGSADCISSTSTAGRPPSYWEVVRQAVNEALVAPINGEVAFGLQFFPGKTAAELSCDVAAAPEVSPAAGTQLEIMRQMLEKLPFGLSPVVSVMEKVADAPGVLADPNAVGAVVLLSDGGDNCSGQTQAEIVSRLGTAAKILAVAGVRTFAIRFGSASGESADQAEQLTTVATEGGTASSGAVAYIDAKTAGELDSALASISDQLSTCSFTLGNVPANADRNRANLFLDGEQIGFDAMSTKEAGWNWTDASQTAIELYGNSCTSFKTSRRTNIIVEFGCEQIVVSPD